MTIIGYGIELVRLQATHIEMVRQWRNDDRISRFMDHRDHISSEAQVRWFKGLDPERDFYFLIRAGGDFHGLIHFSAIDWKSGTGQSGLFIRSAEYQGTHLPVSASTLMLEYFFSATELTAIEAKVMNGNTLALEYNRRLGFTEIGSEQPERFHRLQLTKEGFYHAFGPQLDLLKRVYGHEFSVLR